MNKDYYERLLRKYELSAFTSLITVLRAQGDLTAKKRKLIKHLMATLNIHNNRYKAEIRKAINDPILVDISTNIHNGNDDCYMWKKEGRRLIGLLPKVTVQNAFSVIANQIPNQNINGTNCKNVNRVFSSVVNIPTKEQLTRNRPSPYSETIANLKNSRSPPIKKVTSKSKTAVIPIQSLRKSSLSVTATTNATTTTSTTTISTTNLFNSQAKLTSNCLTNDTTIIFNSTHNYCAAPSNKKQSDNISESLINSTESDLKIYQNNNNNNIVLSKKNMSMNHLCNMNDEMMNTTSEVTITPVMASEPNMGSAIKDDSDPDSDSVFLIPRHSSLVEIPVIDISDL